jgi:hypothetical protein
MLTLYTTPVVYLYVDRWQQKVTRWRKRRARRVIANAG